MRAPTHRICLQHQREIVREGMCISADSCVVKSVVPFLVDEKTSQQGSSNLISFSRPCKSSVLERDFHDICCIDEIIECLIPRVTLPKGNLSKAQHMTLKFPRYTKHPNNNPRVRGVLAILTIFFYILEAHKH